MQMSDGLAELRAPDGAFHYDSNRVDVHGPLQFRSQSGYSFSTSDVSIDLKQQHATGAGGISGETPSGTFSASRIDVDLDERTVTLTGGARLRMQPGKARTTGQ
jgi:lipopolysaccharide export system protein LptC